MRALAALALAAASTPALGQSDPERARTLFLVNCATCHGEVGDGKGTTQLDRPARSFLDGGFSFGNTPEALFKTISTGIPGSPMAGFDSSLSEEERRLLASYVVTLGPPVEEVEEADMIVPVHDRPLIVRGLLPALGEGLSTHPRGLLIGDPSGITFEYRVDDVRLLGLRQGGFVKRTDWSGRGGTPLEPLGKVVHLVEGGKPEATFWRGKAPLIARLSGTEFMNPVNGGCFATLQYHLVDATGELGHVMEVPLVRTESIGTGYSRTIDIKGTSAAHISLRTPAVSNIELLASGSQPEFHEQWQVVKATSGQPVFQLLISYGKEVSTRRTELGQLEATIALEPGARDAKLDMKAGFDLWELVLVDWNEQVRADLARWYEDF